MLDCYFMFKKWPNSKSSGMENVLVRTVFHDEQNKVMHRVSNGSWLSQH